MIFFYFQVLSYGRFLNILQYLCSYAYLQWAAVAALGSAFAGARAVTDARAERGRDSGPGRRSAGRARAGVVR